MVQWVDPDWIPVAHQSRSITSLPLLRTGERNIQVYPAFSPICSVYAVLYFPSKCCKCWQILATSFSLEHVVTLKMATSTTSWPNLYLTCCRMWCFIWVIRSGFCGNPAECNNFIPPVWNKTLVWKISCGKLMLLNRFMIDLVALFSRHCIGMDLSLWQNLYICTRIYITALG